MTWEQVTLAIVGGAFFGATIIWIARRGVLSMRYTIGWSFIAVCIMLSGLLGGVLSRVARAIGIDPILALASVAGVTMLAITVQLSITVSGLTERVRTLAELCAILEQQLCDSSTQSMLPDSAGSLTGPDPSSTSPPTLHASPESAVEPAAVHIQRDKGAQQ